MMDASFIQLTDLRKYLHRQPELSGAEIKTAREISDFIQQLNIECTIKQVGGTGLLVSIHSGKKGPSLLFRSELDALPIEELNDFEYRSVVPGVSHKCGHDGHMAILCGLAKLLAIESVTNGVIHLLFQPAEETGEGASKVLEDPAFGINPDFVFALHNLPGYERNSVVIKDGSFTSAVNSIIIQLTGKTTHAAEPQAGINPAGAVSELLQFAQALNQPEPGKVDFRLVTPVYMRMGEPAYGTAAGAAELHFTLRSWNNEHLQSLEQRLLQGTEEIAQRHGLTWKHSDTQSFSATVNDPVANDVVRKAVSRCGLKMMETSQPFKWGEDFGYFTSRFRGCMFGLGAGPDHPALHNPDYDFPDELIETGAILFHSIAKILTGTSV